MFEECPRKCRCLTRVFDMFERGRVHNKSSHATKETPLLLSKGNKERKKRRMEWKDENKWEKKTD